MRLSIVMPTYNDALTIERAVESVLSQTFEEWELIIVDDGSTDGTPALLSKMVEDPRWSGRLHTMRQENTDQLGAISIAASSVTGDYVYILHSDDRFCDDTVLERALTYMDSEPGHDAYFVDYRIVDTTGSLLLEHHVRAASGDHEGDLNELTLNLGKNIYADTAFLTKETFHGVFSETYLRWNMPFWSCLYSDREKLGLSLDNIRFPVFDYQVGDESYNRSRIGQLNVLNGELRTLLHLLSRRRVPSYELKYYLYRLQMRFFSVPLLKGKMKSGSDEHIARILGFAYEKARIEDWESNPFLSALVSFFSIAGSSEHLILEQLPDGCPLYQGRDMRSFNQALISGELHPYHQRILAAIASGTRNYTLQGLDAQTARALFRFYCIDDFVEYRGESR